jgi:NADPH2:quinone reductase
VKAIVCTRHGPPEALELLEVDAPSPGTDDVLIEVEAAGVNFPDTLIIEGRYQFRPEPPFSPGAEIAGRVLAVGAAVEGLAKGDPVIATLTWGGYAEQVVAKAVNVTRLPAPIDPGMAAAFALVYGTSFHALRDRASLTGGETLLVLGAAGGVGLAAVELGVLMGAQVIAAAGSPERLAACQRQGAHHLIDYERENLRDAVRRITGDKGVDVVYDAVGGRHSEAAFRSLGWGGRHLVVGFAAGEIPRLPLNLPLLKGASLVGVFWGDFVRRAPLAHQANMNQLLSWLVSGRLKPLVSRRYPLAQASAALRDLLDRKIEGKAVIMMQA